MELMDMKDYDIDFKEKRTNGYLIATLFIIVGILFLLRNLGMIDPSLFDLADAACRVGHLYDFPP